MFDVLVDFEIYILSNHSMYKHPFYFYCISS